MTAPDIPRDPTDSLALLLGPRQAEVMRLLWAHGPATVAELHAHLPTLAYTTVMTICARLAEKGLLDRRRVAEDDDRSRRALAYVYTPRMSAADVARLAISRRRAPSLLRRPAVHVPEHSDPSGVCRVCGQPAPPARADRHDGLRVCRAAACRQEAHRRDNVAKQRRYRERHRTPDGQAEPAVFTSTRSTNP